MVFVLRNKYRGDIHQAAQAFRHKFFHGFLIIREIFFFVGVAVFMFKRRDQRAVPFDKFLYANKKKLMIGNVVDNPTLAAIGRGKHFLSIRAAEIC